MIKVSSIEGLSIFFCFLAILLPVTVFADIMFVESFDDGAFSTRGWYDNTSLTISNTEYVPGSSGSVEFHFSEGAKTPVSGSAIRKKFTESDSIYVSYYVKYSSNWQGSNKAYHPHEFYILTNLDGDWTGPAYTYLTAYIEQNEGVPLLALQDGKNIDESRIGQDLTEITEQRAVAGCNSDNSEGNESCYPMGRVHWNGKYWKADQIYFQDAAGEYNKNEWHFVEAYFKLNSISNGIGLADGVVQYWYDTELIIDHSNIMFRTGEHPNMKFNQFIIGPWIGDGSPVDQTFWVDNLSVATTTPITVNDPPTADDQSVTVSQDSSNNTIVLTGSDINDDSLTCTVVSSPANGTLGGSSPNVLYTPNAGYVGSDSFTFRANDGHVDSVAAMVTITIEDTVESSDDGGSSGCFLKTAVVSFF